jgi:hypothetical protein
MLNETQAQLQLALLGTSDDYQEKTNSTIRRSLKFKGDKGSVRNFSFETMHILNSNKELKSAVDNIGKCPFSKESQITGPLGRLMQTRCPATDTEN